MFEYTNENLTSVYITTYNRVELLKRAVQSVLNQSVQPYEILIVDDNSTDGTQQYLSTLQHKDKRIKWLKKSKIQPPGPQSSRNLAINSARGFFITGLDDDDYFTPDRLLTLQKAYKPHYSFVCSNYYRVSSSNISLSSIRPRKVTYKHLLNYNCVGNQVLSETWKLQKVGGFDLDLEACQDLDVWLRLTKEFGPGYRTIQPTYYQDFNPEVQRITFSDKKKIGTIQFCKKYEADIPLDVVKKRVSLLEKRGSIFDKIMCYSPRLIMIGIQNCLKLG
jgi:glycosyltransferase involved in cell wall biosynthesis